MTRFLTGLFTTFILLTIAQQSAAQLGVSKTSFTRQDTLRGSLTPERTWWNVMHYHIYVEPDYAGKSIKGWNEISFTTNELSTGKRMQIDLQQPMEIDSILFHNKRINSFTRDGNVFYIDFQGFDFAKNRSASSNSLALYNITIYFHGKVREAIRPPWDGGWIWVKDDKGRPWMSVACQGLGASVWYPCKDYQGDEPDEGAVIEVKVPDTLVAVANGRMLPTKKSGNNTSIYSWQVVAPINNYNIVPYIGKYVHWSDSYKGETGKKLSLDYWVLDYDEAAAKVQFDRDVKRMIEAFEYWFGPYPFYEDGYKLVESPHLGMEHQSATAYGNHFMNGYLGSDLSGSGWGLKWDYIIVHESGHEWFANNITTNDIADMWVHEGFAMYSEVLFTEYWYGKKAGDEYDLGIRKGIDNDRPLIGPYGVNKEGSSDMYNKGANLLHTIRAVINNDTVFRSILRGLNHDFYHKTVDSKDVETYFSKHAGKDLSRIFDQYLRTTDIPTLEYDLKGTKLQYRWTNCVPGFNMPLKVGSATWLKPTTSWTIIPVTKDMVKNGKLLADPRFYIIVKRGS